ncbi:MAG: flagellin [Chloroflexota bacterium]|jgi:flagellin
MAQGDFTRINTNIGALNALNSLKAVQTKLGVAQLRLATGKRINEAADDPSGLTIATKFQYRASGLGVALDNIGDAKNLMAVAEGGLTKIKDILIKMRDKANAAASDTLGGDERKAIQSQLNAWAEEINNIVETTKWNNNKLLDGLQRFENNKIIFQVGVENDAAERLELDGASFSAVTTTELGIGALNAAVTPVEGADTSVISGVAPIDLDGADDDISTTGDNDPEMVLPELANGTYTIRVSIADDGTGKVQLLDAQGLPMYINDKIDGSKGFVATEAAFNYDDSGDNTIYFGNGIKCTIAGGLDLTDGKEATITFDYVRAGTYNGDVNTAAAALSALTNLDNAITEVSARLQDVGTLVSRMNFREETVTIAKVNVEAAFNRIMNADMAWEQLEATKYQILQQTATAMLSQANMAPQGILQLFR